LFEQASIAGEGKTAPWHLVVIILKRLHIGIRGDVNDFDVGRFAMCGVKGR
jgi:hypothetical protein